MNPVTRFMVATLVAIALLIIGVLMNGPSELQAAQDVADEAAYAAAVADGGASKCAALGHTALWTTEGHLVCRLPARPAVLAQGGAL